MPRFRVSEIRPTFSSASTWWYSLQGFSPRRSATCLVVRSSQNASRNGGAAQFGWLSSAPGVGLIVGGVALGVWGGFRNRIVTALTAMSALGVAVMAVGLTPAASFLWALASMSCVGLIAPLVNGPVYAILHATIAPDYQGRVFSLIGSLAGAAAAGSARGRPGRRDGGCRYLVPGGRDCLRGDGNRGLFRARPDGNRRRSGGRVRLNGGIGGRAIRLQSGTAMQRPRGAPPQPIASRQAVSPGELHAQCDAEALRRAG